jgi:hypothetical protein
MTSLYNLGDKTQISRPPSDALLLLDSEDRSSSSSSAGGAGILIPQSQPYNNFRLQRPQNLLQGGFTRVQLTEVNFPYAVPNIVNGITSFFYVQVPSLANVVARIDVVGATGIQDAFLNGDELADIIEFELNGTPSIGTAAGLAWVVKYRNPGIAGLNNTNGFYIRAGLAVAPFTGYTFNLSPIPFVSIGVVPVPQKSLLQLMGFDPLSNWEYITSTPSVYKLSWYAPLTFTQYIDIVSDKLTYYQNVKDGSTKSSSSSNIICRLYVSDETSTFPVTGQYWDTVNEDAVTYNVWTPPGSAPFLIHRQYTDPKTFGWEKNTSIDFIDIKLLDDGGNLLYTPAEGLPNFQITFKASED